jgi:hypothetical protein
MNIEEDTGRLETFRIEPKTLATLRVAASPILRVLFGHRIQILGMGDDNSFALDSLVQLHQLEEL